ncbi:hypothetical protein [Pararhizobium qamdonense]|uniref:hypothetical protein n=1 Tax=Pararhizobium qamdonense TaxID=3031126 RepID=UPI0023E24EAA|nr:hypothetical protein [Pararhizobium qamdonense]
MQTDLITGRVDPKRALEQAIGKIGKAYGELLRVAEKHGDDIERADYDKAQFFLNQTIAKIWEKIDVVRDVAKATNGEFSLDSVKLPETETIKWYSHPGAPPRDLVLPKGMFGQELISPAAPIDPASMDGKSLAKAIGGRLSKAAQQQISRPAPSVKVDLSDDDDELGSPDTSPDSSDGVDFIDD